MISKKKHEPINEFTMNVLYGQLYDQIGRFYHSFDCSDDLFIRTLIIFYERGLYEK